MFFGEYNYQLDEKNRIRIPSKLRNEFAGSYIVTKGTNHSLFVFAKDYFQTQFLDKLNSVPTFDSEAQRPIRALLSSSFEVEEDKQGRFVLPTNLRNFAGISKNIVFVGVGNRLEIWSEDNWNNYVADSSDFDNVVTKLSQYDV